MKITIILTLSVKWQLYLVSVGK